MSKIRLATNKKSCHTLWAAKLTQTQHDVSTILIYYLHGCVRNLRSLPHEPSSKITRHTKLIHAVTHCPPSSERPTLCSRHVGVDGSFIEAGQGGKPMASGAACYFTHARGATGPISPAAHIITCTFGRRTNSRYIPSGAHHYMHLWGRTNSRSLRIRLGLTRPPISRACTKFRDRMGPRHRRQTHNQPRVRLEPSTTRHPQRHELRCKPPLYLLFICPYQTRQRPRKNSHNKTHPGTHRR